MVFIGLLIAVRMLSFAQEKPNIVLFYIDDWAWNGTPIAMNASMENSFMPILEMPNLDQLARQGMKFTNAYGSPQCAPARVSLQTGQTSARSGFTLVMGKQKDSYYDTRAKYGNLPVVPNISDESIDADALTIPEALKPLGYVSAHIGKWHMYSDPGAEGYVLHDGDTDNKPGNSEDPEDPKLLFSSTEKAIGFIEEQVKNKQAFYCQISHYAMHKNSQCTEETRKKYAKHPLVQDYYKKHGLTTKGKNDPATWLGMGEDLDGRIGAVLNKIKELGIEKNTYIVVVSDNGYRHDELGITPGLKQALHGHKWWAWQAGIRVPMIVKGPTVKENSVFNGNVANYDLLPTFVDWAGGNPKDLKNIDGISLAKYMSGKKPEQHFLNRGLYFHVPHYRQEIPHSAIISGNNKVIHFYESPDIPMLFDLSKDAGEVHNIAVQHPEKHSQLLSGLMKYLKDVDARIPKINPDYDPAVYKQQRNYEKYMQWGAFEGTRVLEADE